MTQSIKILQLNTEPPVSVYNHHAFGTGIITTAPWGMNWIYNNYIMLGFYPDEGALTFDFYMDYIQNCVLPGEEADMRPTGILYNHRRLMCERMKLMEKAGLADTEALNSAKEQLKLCEMLKNRQMLYNMRGKDGDKEKLIELTDKFKGVKLPHLCQMAYEFGSL